MSDFNSSLPIRTQNNGDVVAKIGDGTTPSQQLAIDSTGRITSKLNDGAGNAVTSQTNGTQRALDVGIDVAGVQIDPRSIRALTSTDVVSVVQSTSPWVSKDQADGPVTPGTVASFSELIGGQFNTSLPTLTTGQQAAIQVDSSGRLLVNIAASAGAIAVTQSTSPWVTSDLADGSVAGGTAGTKSMLAGGIFNTALPTLTNGQQASLQFTSSGKLIVDNSTVTQPVSGTVTSNQGTANTAANAWPVTLATGGTANGPTNPIFVTSSDIVGTSIDNYNTASALAAAATSNHDYTVTAAKTFYGKQFWAAASGKLKIEVQYETGAATGVFNSFWVGFNSTANPYILIPVPTSKTQVAGARIRIIRSNLDLLSQDVYSTTSGTEQ